MSTIEVCRSLVQEAFSSRGNWEGNFAQAESLLSAALVKEPSNPLLLTCLGAVLCDQGKYETATEVLGRAIALGSRDRNSFFNLGVTVLNSGTQEQATQLFAKARLLESSAQSWEAYFDPQAQ